MEFNKKSKKGKIVGQAEEPIEEPPKPIKQEQEVRLVTSEQLMNFKLDTLEIDMRKIGVNLEEMNNSFLELNQTIKKALEN